MTELLLPLRLGLCCVRNGWRSTRKAPDYVYFMLEGPLPALREPKPKWWRRYISPTPPLSLEELAERFDRIAGHKGVRGVVLHLRELALPRARLETLQGMLADLRRRGKEVVVWATSYKRVSYQLAMHADKVLLQEGGSIGVLGISSAHTYLGDSLAWAGLKMEAVQISPYKSAADRLTRADMSQEVWEMHSWLLDSYYSTLKRDIACGRRVSEEKAEEIVSCSPYTAQRALGLGLVDGVISEEDVPHYLGRDGQVAVLSPWQRAEKALRVQTPLRRNPCIGVIRITGNIVDGVSAKPPVKPPLPIPFLFSERAGDISVVAQARAALRDKRVKGVLLYVDSGGGSATASEAMYQALAKLAAKKPVVALMGSVAASGGYYVTTAAQWVVASSGTITGSIGVLTGKLVDGPLLKRLLANRITLYRGDSALLESSDQPYTPRERQVEWESISSIYELFLRRVAKARHRTPMQIDAVGGGRVWTGEQALAHGLVDELGGLRQAISKVRELANLPPHVGLKDMAKAKAEPPLPSPADAFSYAFDSMKLFSPLRALFLCPLTLEGDDR
ncbi:MAG: Protease 4 [Firmicutes bacterium]|nr:Protease 4 [Bacillota bacterium]